VKKKGRRGRGKGKGGMNIGREKERVFDKQQKKWTMNML
jgi:hypothetical protein